MPTIRSEAFMGELKWYKRDPNAVLGGIGGLDLEERGAYLTVLELIYSNDGAIEDNERLIAGWLRVDIRVWRRLRHRLLDLGKLYVNGPNLRNARADREVSDCLKRYRDAVQAGMRSATKRGADITVLKNIARANRT
jgi:hypothetical protein